MVEGWIVSPRKSRRKSACFSSTVTPMPARASRYPAIIPAGPPPTTMQLAARALRADMAHALRVRCWRRAGHERARTQSYHDALAVLPSADLSSGPEAQFVQDRGERRGL